MKKGDKLTLPACTFTPPYGMIFAGWRIGSGSEQPGASGAITKDTEIRATWKTAPRETITEAINISLTAPKINAHPNFNATLDSSKCEFIIDSSSVYPVTYMINGSSQMYESESFVSGNFYRAFVFLKAKTTSEKMYVFPSDSSQINVFINGKRATVGWINDTTIRAYYDFTPEAPDPPLTGTVTITQETSNEGIKLNANLGGAAAGVPAGRLHYEWRYVLTTDPYGRLRSIGGDEKTLVLNARDYSNYRFIVYVTADGYDGALQSSYYKVESSSSYKKGDVNRDGDLDNADLILVARYVVNLITFDSQAFKLGDMDDSGEIDNADIIRLARLLVGLS